MLIYSVITTDSRKTKTPHSFKNWNNISYHIGSAPDGENSSGSTCIIWYGVYLSSYGLLDVVGLKNWCISLIYT